MTIETLPGYIKVETPEQAKPLPYTRFETIGLGFTGGLNETSYSYLGDISQRLSTKYGSLDENSLTEEEFRKIPGITDDMEYYAGMTYEVANRFLETRAARQEFQLSRENSDFFTTGYYLLGGIGGSIPDFVNFLPLGLPRKGATLLANAGRAAGANVAIELALTPAAAYAYKNRGEEYTAEDLRNNLMFAAGAGAGISALGTGIRGLAGIAETYGLMAYPKDPVEVAAIQARAASGEYAITPSFGRLLQAEQIKYSQQAGVSVRNTDPFPTEAGTKRYIDTTGQIHGTTDSVRTNDFVTVGIDPDGRKVLSGSNEAVLKILPSMKRYLKDGEELVIKRNDLPGRDVSVGKQSTTTLQKLKKNVDDYFTGKIAGVPEKKLVGIDDYVSENEFKLNNKLISQFLPSQSQAAGIAEKVKKLFTKPFVAQLDDSVAFTSRDVGNVRYEGEFEIKGEKRGFDPENGIGKIYEVDNATGQRRLLDNNEAKQVLNVLGDLADNRNSSKIEQIRKTDPEQQTRDENPLGLRAATKGKEHANDPTKTNEIGNEPKIKTAEEIQQERANKPVVDPELKKTHGDFLTEAAVIGNLKVFNDKYGIVFNTNTRRFEIGNRNIYEYLNDVDKKNADKMLAMEVDKIRTDKDVIAQAMETRKDCA